MPGTALAQQCFFDGALGLDFGTIDPSGATSTATTNIRCQSNDPNGPALFFKGCIYIDYGPHGDASSRKLVNFATTPNTVLEFDLFADAAHTQKILPPTEGPPYYTGLVEAQPGETASVPASVHGLVYPGQTGQPVGNYQETGISGMLYYRYSSAGIPVTEDCLSGGDGGGSFFIPSSSFDATVEAGCQITTADLDFGDTPPPDADVLAATNIGVSCPANTTWQVGLDDGQHHDGSTRRMQGPGGFVAYELYRDSGRNQRWGNTEDSDTLPGTTDGAGTPVSIPVYGLVPAQPDAAPGNYSDTVIATVYY